MIFRCSCLQAVSLNGHRPFATETNSPRPLLGIMARLGRLGHAVQVAMALMQAAGMAVGVLGACALPARRQKLLNRLCGHAASLCRCTGLPLSKGRLSLYGLLLWRRRNCLRAHVVWNHVHCRCSKHHCHWCRLHLHLQLRHAAAAHGQRISSAVLPCHTS